MTNEQTVNELIETAKKLGGYTYAPASPSLDQELADKKQAVLARMRPDIEITPKIRGETFKILPPKEFDPQRDLPIGFLKDDPKISGQPSEKHSGALDKFFEEVAGVTDAALQKVLQTNHPNICPTCGMGTFTEGLNTTCPKCGIVKQTATETKPPICLTCGHVTERSGFFFKCPNCGESVG